MLKHLIALIIAMISDGIDFGLFGELPIVGDAVDVITIFLLMPFISVYSLVGFIELMPLEDLFPTFTLTVLLSWYEERQKNRNKKWIWHPPYYDYE